MFTKSLIRTLAPVAGASILLLGLAGGASAYQCKRANLIASYAGVGHMVALAAAKAQWTAKAKTNYGLSWSVWNIAAGKNESCVAAGGGAFNCVVKAKPCNYVVP